MADIATLGLVVDASGARREVKLTTDQIKALANGGKEAQQAMRNLAPPAVVQNMQRATEAVKQQNTVVTANIQGQKRLQNAMQAMAMSAIGAAPGVGQLTSVLGSFALSTPLMVGVLAGIAALAFAWDKAGAAARRAKQEQQDGIGALQAIRDKNRNPILGGLPGAITAATNQQQDLEAELRTLQAARAKGNRRYYDEQIAAKKREIEDVKNLIMHGNQEIARLNREHAEELARIAKEAADKRIAEAKRLRDAQMAESDANAIAIGLPGLQTMGMNRGVAVKPIQADVYVSVARLGQQAAENVRAAARTAEILSEVTDKQQRNQQLLQAGLQLLSRYGGAAGGIASSAIQGFQSGGMWGAAINGGMALVDTIVGFGKAAREAAERLKQMKAALTDTILGWRAALGDKGAGRQQRMNQILAESQAAQDNLNAQFWTHLGLDSNNPEYIRQLKEIKQYTQDRINALIKEGEVLKQNDLKESIKGLTSLIDSLAEFKGSLSLSDLSPLSPMAKLAEAKRQYEEILGKARGGDQNAAGQLPQFAQAFLQASRSVNASGMAYQRDFARVVKDTDEVMKVFEAMRTIDQQQLDVLRGIRDGSAEVGKETINRLDFINDAIHAVVDAISDASDSRLVEAPI